MGTVSACVSWDTSDRGVIVCGLKSLRMKTTSV